MQESLDVSIFRQKFETEALASLFSELDRRGVRYAVLRNYESIPVSVGARDIDIIVMPKDLLAAKSAVCAMAKELHLRFANTYCDERLTQFVIIRRIPSGEVLELKVDFFTNSQIYGIEAYSAQEVLKEILLHNGIPVANDKFVFIDKWLFHVLVGQPLHPKYDQEFAEICKREKENLLTLLTPCIGKELANNLITGVALGSASTMRPLTRQKRLGLLLKMFIRKGLKGIWPFLDFLLHRIQNLCNPKGIFISVSGPDGSGKTTLIDKVITQLQTIYGEDNIVYQHFRPGVFPRIADVAKAACVIKKVDMDYSNPHRANPSGVAASLVRLLYYFLDYLIGYFCTIRPVLLRRKIVIFDRYYYDMICDPERSRIRLPYWFLHFMAELLPLPKLAFFIHVNADEIYHRKQELPLDKIRHLNDCYLNLVRSGSLRKINNEVASQSAASEIVDIVVNDRDAKARCKIRP